jgi:hypothetical protein
MKAILYLAGASLLGVVALAPGTTWAKSDRDLGITVGPGGYVGPKQAVFNAPSVPGLV